MIRKPSTAAFFEFLDGLIRRFPAVALGTVFADVRKELIKALTDYVGRDAALIGPGDVAALDTHFEKWFGRLAAPRRVFVPCVISPWAAPRFSIGPADFVFIDDLLSSDFYPPAEDLLGRYEFERMLAAMQEGRANWLARISVEECDRFKAEEIGALSAALAIVAIQLAIPLPWGMRNMGRLDACRGLAERRTISEAAGLYVGSWSRVEAGISIGTGILADALQDTMPVIKAVGSLVKSFASGRYRLPKLERA